MLAPNTLDELLVLEDDPAFAELACPSTGVLAWPAIRNDVFRLLLSDLIYPTAPIVELGRHGSVPNVVLAGIRSAAHAARHQLQRSDVLIVGTGAGLMPRGLQLFNRYTDYFADALGSSAWTAESLFEDRWPARPRSNPRLSFLAIDRLKVAARMKVGVAKVHLRIAGELVGLVRDRAYDRLGWELDPRRQGSLVASTARRLAAYPLRASNTADLLRRVKPEHVLVEEAAYGHMAVFNATAREAMVHVAEFQHGMVTHGHDAYNVAPSLAETSAYRRTQPQAFLAYGTWWNQQFNAPIEERVALGNPHRSEVLRAWSGAPSRSSVVVLGDGIETIRSLEFASSLAAKLSHSLRVAFRPHPRERALIQNAPPGVLIDAEPDILASFAGAEAVVGEASTGLFEAIDLVPRVFAWDTPKSRFYLGNDHPFDRVKGADDLSAALETAGRGGLRGATAVDFWSDDWSSRLRRYLNHEAAQG